MDKMVMIVYNEAMDEEVMNILSHCTVKSYTKVRGVHGKGESSGTHLDSDIWPGKNNILYVACMAKQSEQLLARVKELRKKLSHEGIKAFVLPVEEVI
jgi:nitrogen regulatory protein PII